MTGGVRPPGKAAPSRGLSTLRQGRLSCLLRGAWRLLAGGGLLIGTLALAALIIHLGTPLVNTQLDRRAAAPAADDVPFSGPPLFPAPSIALISEDPGEKCGALCLGALLTGQAQTVIAAAAAPPHAEGRPDPLAETGTAFALGQGGACADDGALTLRGAFSPDVFTEDARGIDPKDIAGLMRATGGPCITARPARIDEAGLAIAWGDLGLRRHQGRGWLADSRLAQRVAIWRRGASGWDIVARDTRVDYSRLKSLLPAPALFRLPGTPAFRLPRVWVTTGAMAGASAETHLVARLTGAAGYVHDLRPAAAVAVDNLLDRIEAGAAPEDVSGRLADALGLVQRAGLDGTARIIALVAGTALPDDEAARLVTLMGDDLPDLAQARVDGLFARVAAFVPDGAERLAAFRYRALADLDWELSDAPPAALARHAATIAAVAANREARDHFDATILAFAATGEVALPAFLALLDDVAAIHRDTDWPAYQGMSAGRTLRLGLRGLCRTTLAGIPRQRALDEIAVRVRSGALPGAPDDWLPVVAALFTLGQAEAGVAALLQGKAGAPDSQALAELAEDARRFPTCGD